jgi:predicted DsbA family dithiol-disulfide isomerase
MDLAELFGPRRLPMMRDHLVRFAESFGVPIEQQPRMPNTRRALAAAEYARDAGRLDPFRHEAMRAYWREGRDLEDPAVIQAIARTAGVDPGAAAAAMHEPRWLARVDAARDEAERLGVTGIPTFLFGEQRVVGCQPYAVLAAAAERAGAPRR